jgi:hypothetical protein
VCWEISILGSISLTNQRQEEVIAGRNENLRNRRSLMNTGMKWFFGISLFFWTLVAIAAPVVVFYLTKNPAVLSLVSSSVPPAFLWRRVINNLFPLNAQTLELERLKILAHILIMLKRIQK